MGLGFRFRVYGLRVEHNRKFGGQREKLLQVTSTVRVSPPQKKTRLNQKTMLIPGYQ